MDNKRTRPKIYRMLPEELTNFVHNIAIPGDIAYSHDAETKRYYVYFCTTENVGEDVNPCWMMTDERAILRERLNTMSLEEKIDFLIERLI